MRRLSGKYAILSHPVGFSIVVVVYVELRSGHVDVVTADSVLAAMDAVYDENGDRDGGDNDQWHCYVERQERHLGSPNTRLGLGLLDFRCYLLRFGRRRRCRRHSGRRCSRCSRFRRCSLCRDNITGSSCSLHWCGMTFEFVTFTAKR